jgi:uncharacterized Rossmann fold enzyme
VQRKLTITLDDKVVSGLYQVVGRQQISRFIEALVRPHVVTTDLDAAYREMAANEREESEALEWAEGMVGDIADEAG